MAKHFYVNLIDVLMDKEALRILLRYKNYSRKTLTINEVTEEEFTLAKGAGLMFDSIKLSHNQAVDWLLEARQKVKKEQVVAYFLASFLSNRLDWRCGLPAYALSMHFPHHTYQKDNSFYCPVCGDDVYSDVEEVDLSYLNGFRFRSGSAMVGDDLYQVDLLAFCLEQQALLPDMTPSKEDVNVFKDIINLVEQANPTDTPNDLEKSLSAKKLFKSNHWQRRYMLETLSFCNIIEHPKATGYTTKFIPPNKRFRDDHMSEWDYPIRLWRGQYGVNQKALQYWFGSFL